MGLFVFSLGLVSAVSTCDNGEDEDSDGYIDFPDDTGCSSAEDNDEISCVDSDCGLYSCVDPGDSCRTSCAPSQTDGGGDYSNDACADGYACASDSTCSKDADGNGLADSAACSSDSLCGKSYSCDRVNDACFTACTYGSDSSITIIPNYIECSYGSACAKKGVCSVDNDKNGYADVDASKKSTSKSRKGFAAELDSSSPFPWILGGIGVLLIGGVSYWFFTKKNVAKKTKK